MGFPVPGGVDPELFRTCEEFMRFSYDLLGAYLDAVGGLSSIRAALLRYQAEKIAGLKASDPSKATEDFMDRQPMSHELIDGNGTTKSKHLHRATQGEFKRRTVPDGLDARFLGWMVVTLLYGSWEDEYREKIARHLGYADKSDLKQDLFGDLAQLRHAILHNGGVATSKVVEAKVLRWFSTEETIFISQRHADFRWHEIDLCITKLCGIRLMGSEQNGSVVE